MKPEFDTLLRKYSTQEEELSKQLSVIQSKIAVLKDLRTETLIESLSQNLVGLNIDTIAINNIPPYNYGLGGIMNGNTMITPLTTAQLTALTTSTLASFNNTPIYTNNTNSSYNTYGTNSSTTK